MSKVASARLPACPAVPPNTAPSLPLPPTLHRPCRSQDCHLLLPLPLGEPASCSDDECACPDPPPAVLIGAFDGHGVLGAAASRYTRTCVVNGVRRNQWRRASAPGGGEAEAAQQLLEAAFAAAGSAIEGSGLELRESGSTAVVCLLEPGRVTAAWAGDSRAVLGLHLDRPGAGPACLVRAAAADEKQGSPVPSTHAPVLLHPDSLTIVLPCSCSQVHPLTTDHRPSRPLERRRIEAAGGQVLQVARDAAGKPTGPFRLCGSNPYLSPRPMVSRCFGDTSE